MQTGYKNNHENLLANRLFGCPLCYLSRYVVLTKEIKDKSFHHNELYCHSCNILFSMIHSVPPFEL